MNSTTADESKVAWAEITAAAMFPVAGASRQKPKSVPKVSTGHFFRGHFDLSQIWTPRGHFCGHFRGHFLKRGHFWQDEGSVSLGFLGDVAHCGH